MRGNQSNPYVSETGATMVEFVFSAALFFTLLIVSMESAVLGFRALTTQYTASAVAREAILGATTLPQIKAHAQSLAHKFGVALNANTHIQVCTITNNNIDAQGNCVNQTAGRPGEFIMVRIDTPVTYMFGVWKFSVRGFAVARKEHR